MKTDIHFPACPFTVPAPLSNVTVFHRSNSYLNISWTPPDILENVTGYIIFYYGDDSSSGNVTISHSSADNYQLTGPQSRVHYVVSIATLSHHLPSEVVTINGKHICTLISILHNWTFNFPSPSSVSMTSSHLIHSSSVSHMKDATISAVPLSYSISVASSHSIY